MNCQEFRRKLLEEPTCSEKAFLEHAARCAECNREHRHALQFEAELFRAMHVEPPANLESRIRQKIGASEPSKPHARHLPWLAAAAGLILLLGASLWVPPHWSPFSRGPSGLAANVLQHIDREPEALAAHQELSDAALQSLFAEFGAHLNGELWPVTHATRCPMRHRDGVHLVMKGRHGPVTVLIMPGEHLGGPVPVHSRHLSGMIVPTNYGSMAVVGAETEFVEPLITKLRASVHWGA